MNFDHDRLVILDDKDKKVYDLVDVAVPCETTENLMQGLSGSQAR